MWKTESSMLMWNWKSNIWVNMARGKDSVSHWKEMTKKDRTKITRAAADRKKVIQSDRVGTIGRLLKYKQNEYKPWIVKKIKVHLTKNFPCNLDSSKVQCFESFVYVSFFLRKFCISEELCLFPEKRSKMTKLKGLSLIGNNAKDRDKRAA